MSHEQSFSEYLDGTLPEATDKQQMIVENTPPESSFLVLLSIETVSESLTQQQFYEQLRDDNTEFIPRIEAYFIPEDRSRQNTPDPLVLRFIDEHGEEHYYESSGGGVSVILGSRTQSGWVVGHYNDMENWYTDRAENYITPYTIFTEDGDNRLEEVGRTQRIIDQIQQGIEMDPR